MKFAKIQGAGNDFVVINNLELNIPTEELSGLAAHLCRRKMSIGGDGFLAVDAPKGDADFRMRYYNQDGSLAEMCGNGARCIARYAWENGLAGDHMRFETMAGVVEAWRITSRQYRIRMNDPSLVERDKVLVLDGKEYRCDYIELGNPGIPHGVIEWPGFDQLPRRDAREMAAKLRNHPDFPKGANMNFYQVEADGTLALLTYERGVEDFTLACGTGACATALSARLSGKAGDKVTLHPPGGDLTVDIENAGTNLYLSGDTNIIAVGEVLDKDLGALPQTPPTF